jgi:hypothetical protein
MVGVWKSLNHIGKAVLYSFRDQLSEVINPFLGISRQDLFGKNTRLFEEYFFSTKDDISSSSCRVSLNQRKNFYTLIAPHRECFDQQ